MQHAGYVQIKMAAAFAINSHLEVTLRAQRRLKNFKANILNAKYLEGEEWTPF